MKNEFSPKHLEVLVKLAVSNEPIKYTKFLPDLNPILDLMHKHYVNKIGDSYELSFKGEKYFYKILAYASEQF